MNKRILQTVATTLIFILAFGTTLPLVASPNRKTKRPVYYPLVPKNLSAHKAKPTFAARVQAASLLPGQTATLLPDGRALLIGGESDNGATDETAISDPRSGEPIPLRSKLHQARAWHSATMLPDGRVLIAGGIGNNGLVVRSAEIFDPQTQSFNLLPASEGAARAYHTATLLTNGVVLITGGSVGRGAMSDTSQLWDFKTGSFTTLSSKLSTARQKHRAILLHDGNVLIEGGDGDNGKRVDVAELYNASAGTFSFSSISANEADLREPILTASLPSNGATDVPVDSFASLLFSKPLRVETINSDTLILSGPEGTVKTKTIPAESGKLAFITPAEPLLPGVTYTINVSGIVAANNQSITPASISFTTKADPESDNGGDGQEWIPDEGNLHGSWKSKFKDSQWRSLPPLQAKEGETALAGQTLMLDGKPLNNVTLRIGSNTTVSDNTGRFILTGIPPGHQVLTIDGRTANRNRRVYGIFRVGVQIKEGKTTALEYTIWMSKLDLAGVKNIPSPTSSRTVVTNPRIPGLELILPAGTVIRGTEGQNVSQISITPIPTNQPPFPLPPGIDVPVYFTVQPGGSQIIPPRAQLIYPNFVGSKPGTRIDFWNYDPTGKGWYVYGQGTVTPNGRQIVPDPGVVLYEFTGAMVGSPSLAALLGPLERLLDGDPVDLGTGLFIVEKTDLMLPDTIPINLTRTYRQNDTRSRAFGIGAMHPYDIFLVGTSFPYTYQEVILPDGGRIHFDRISPGTDFDGAVYENTTVPGPFYKARIQFIGNSWRVFLKNGTILFFPDSFGASHSRQAALVHLQDRYGNVIVFNRDGNKNLTKITSTNNRWIQFTYDDQNRVTTATDSIGRTVLYTYDASGRLWKVTDANNGVTEYTYDSSHRMLTIKDPRGIVYLTNEYDPVSGRVIKQTLADDTPAISTDNPTYLFNYTTDSGGRVVQTDVTDPRGHLRRVTFATNGYRLTDTSAVGTSDQRSVSYEREAGTNLVRAIIDPLGRRTEYGYDSFGDVTSTIQLAGTASAATTLMTYEPTFHQLASITDPLDHTTEYEYDTSGNLFKITDALDHETILTHNAKGQPTSVKDPLQHTTQFIYDGADLIKIIAPLNRVTSFYRDGAGRIVKITDPLGNWARYHYDALNQVTKITEPSGAVTELTYDSNGNVLSLKDARNQTTSFTYDNMDRVQSRTDSLQGPTSIATYAYDLKGNATKVTDRRGKVTTLSYDALDRLTFAGFGTTAGPTYESTSNYTYDLYNRITQAVDSVSGTISISYDDLARTTTHTTPQGIVSYSYDKVHRMTAKSVSGQPSISYAYDNANRLQTITQGLAGVAFTYDDANRQTSTTLPNGIIEEYTYDAASQLTAITFKDGETVVGDLTYAYDKSGRRTKMGGSVARTLLPQPLSTTSYNAANRLTQSGAATLTYDANGNLTNDGTNTYTWNARNQLTGISGSVSASFQYDAFGRRVRTTINGNTRDYLYDGVNVVQEQVGGTATANMLTGGVDEVYSRTESAGTQSVLGDGLGSTIALLNSEGAPQTDYAYEPFGNTSSSGAVSSNPSQYTGRENDGTGLYYYRARYYSPTFGRFISEDPIGFAGHDTNLYRYVFNSPTNLRDPFGLSASSIAGCLLKGFLIGAAGAAVIAGVAVAVAALGVPTAVVTVGLGAAAIIGVAALSANVTNNIMDRNWDGLAYDIGSAAGAAVVGGLGGRAIAERVNGVPSPPWSWSSDRAQHYNPNLGSVRDWLGTGPNPGSAAGSTAVGGAGAASTAGRSCGC